uniref:C3H1-type domain-containing protein n=1 Tax=Macrostomum lignano TaxID=282301 RepID=A0A1I8HC94_9PLAT
RLLLLLCAKNLGEVTLADWQAVGDGVAVPRLQLRVAVRADKAIHVVNFVVGSQHELSGGNGRRAAEAGALAAEHPEESMRLQRVCQQRSTACSRNCSVIWQPQPAHQATPADIDITAAVWSGICHAATTGSVEATAEFVQLCGGSSAILGLHSGSCCVRQSVVRNSRWQHCLQCQLPRSQRVGLQHNNNDEAALAAGSCSTSLELHGLPGSQSALHRCAAPSLGGGCSLLAACRSRLIHQRRLHLASELLILHDLLLGRNYAPLPAQQVVVLVVLQQAEFGFPMPVEKGVQRVLKMSSESHLAFPAHYQSTTAVLQQLGVALLVCLALLPSEGLLHYQQNPGPLLLDRWDSVEIAIYVFVSIGMFKTPPSKTDLIRTEDDAQPMVEHSLELGLGHEGVGVEHLEAANLAHVGLQPTRCGLSLVLRVLGRTVGPDVNVHLGAVVAGSQHAGIIGQVEGTQPQWVHVDLAVEHLDGTSQVGDRHQHVLDDLMSFVHLLYRLALGELHQGHLGRHGPAKQVAENRVVSKRYNVLHLPEDAARMPVIVVPCGDELNSATGLEEPLDVLEEPGLPVVPDAVDAIRVSLMCWKRPCACDEVSTPVPMTKPPTVRSSSSGTMGIVQPRGSSVAVSWPMDTIGSQRTVLEFGFTSKMSIRLTLREAHHEDDVDGAEAQQVADNHPVDHQHEGSDNLETAAEEQEVRSREQDGEDGDVVFYLRLAGRPAGHHGNHKDAGVGGGQQVAFALHRGHRGHHSAVGQGGVGRHRLRVSVRAGPQQKHRQEKHEIGGEGEEHAEEAADANQRGVLVDGAVLPDGVQLSQRMSHAHHIAVVPADFAVEHEDEVVHLGRLGGQSEWRESLVILDVQPRLLVRQQDEEFLRHFQVHVGLVDDQDMQHGVAVGVLPVGVGVPRKQQPHALLLATAGGEAQGVQVLVIQVADSLVLLILAAEEGAKAALVNVGPVIQQELHHHRVLVGDGDVQHSLAVVHVQQVDVVDHLGIKLDDPPGYIHVNRRGIQEAQVQAGLAHRAPLLQVPADVPVAVVNLRVGAAAAATAADASSRGVGIGVDNVQHGVDIVASWGRPPSVPAGRGLRQWRIAVPSSILDQLGHVHFLALAVVIKEQPHLVLDALVQEARLTSASQVNKSVGLERLVVGLLLDRGLDVGLVVAHCRSHRLARGKTSRTGKAVTNSGFRVGGGCGLFNCFICLLRGGGGCKLSPLAGHRSLLPWSEQAQQQTNPGEPERRRGLGRLRQLTARLAGLGGVPRGPVQNASKICEHLLNQNALKPASNSGGRASPWFGALLGAVDPKIGISEKPTGELTMARSRRLSGSTGTEAESRMTLTSRLMLFSSLYGHEFMKKKQCNMELSVTRTRPLPLAPLDRPGPYDDDDLESSASSDGSEILQMVDQLLLAFNLEVQAESAGAAEEASESAEVLGLLSASALATSFRVPTDGADEDSDYDDDEAFWEAADRGESPPVMYFFDSTDSLEEEEDGDYADNEASSSGSSASAASADPRQPQKQPSAFLATGLFRMPQEAVLEAMDYWGPLDRIRWLLWRPEPCPPRPEAQQQPQPQQLLDKSKRACSFLLKGRCRKEDCEFAHDLSRVTCKFWAAGQCFKELGFVRSFIKSTRGTCIVQRRLGRLQKLRDTIGGPEPDSSSSRRSRQEAVAAEPATVTSLKSLKLHSRWSSWREMSTTSSLLPPVPMPGGRRWYSSSRQRVACSKSCRASPRRRLRWPELPAPASPPSAASSASLTSSAARSSARAASTSATERRDSSATWRQSSAASSGSAGAASAIWRAAQRSCQTVASALAVATSSGPWRRVSSRRAGRRRTGRAAAPRSRRVSAGGAAGVFFAARRSAEIVGRHCTEAAEAAAAADQAGHGRFGHRGQWVQADAQGGRVAALRVRSIRVFKDFFVLAVRLVQIFAKGVFSAGQRGGQHDGAMQEALEPRRRLLNRRTVREGADEVTRRVCGAGCSAQTGWQLGLGATAERRQVVGRRGAAPVRQIWALQLLAQARQAQQHRSLPLELQQPVLQVQPQLFRQLLGLQREAAGAKSLAGRLEEALLRFWGEMFSFLTTQLLCYLELCLSRAVPQLHRQFEAVAPGWRLVAPIQAPRHGRQAAGGLDQATRPLLELPEAQAAAPGQLMQPSLLVEPLQPVQRQRLRVVGQLSSAAGATGRPPRALPQQVELLAHRGHQLAAWGAVGLVQRFGELAPEPGAEALVRALLFHQLVQRQGELGGAGVGGVRDLWVVFKIIGKLRDTIGGPEPDSSSSRRSRQEAVAAEPATVTSLKSLKLHSRWSSWREMSTTSSLLPPVPMPGGRRWYSSSRQRVACSKSCRASPRRRLRWPELPAPASPPSAASSASLTSSAARSSARAASTSATERRDSSATWRQSSAASSGSAGAASAIWRAAQRSCQTVASALAVATSSGPWRRVSSRRAGRRRTGRAAAPRSRRVSAGGAAGVFFAARRSAEIKPPKPLPPPTRPGMGGSGTGVSGYRRMRRAGESQLCVSAASGSSKISSSSPSDSSRSSLKASSAPASGGQHDGAMQEALEPRRRLLNRRTVREGADEVTRRVCGAGCSAQTGWQLGLGATAERRQVVGRRGAAPVRQIWALQLLAQARQAQQHRSLPLELQQPVLQVCSHSSSVSCLAFSGRPPARNLSLAVWRRRSCATQLLCYLELCLSRAVPQLHRQFEAVAPGWRLVAPIQAPRHGRQAAGGLDQATRPLLELPEAQAAAPGQLMQPSLLVEPLQPVQRQRLRVVGQLSSAAGATGRPPRALPQQVELLAHRGHQLAAWGAVGLVQRFGELAPEPGAEALVRALLFHQLVQRQGRPACPPPRSAAPADLASPQPRSAAASAPGSAPNLRASAPTARAQIERAVSSAGWRRSGGSAASRGCRRRSPHGGHRCGCWMKLKRLDRAAPARPGSDSSGSSAASRRMVSMVTADSSSSKPFQAPQRPPISAASSTKSVRAAGREGQTSRPNTGDQLAQAAAAASAEAPSAASSQACGSGAVEQLHQGHDAGEDPAEVLGLLRFLGQPHVRHGPVEGDQRAHLQQRPQEAATSQQPHLRLYGRGVQKTQTTEQLIQRPDGGLQHAQVARPHLRRATRLFLNLDLLRDQDLDGVVSRGLGQLQPGVRPLPELVDLHQVGEPQQPQRQAAVLTCPKRGSAAATSSGRQSVTSMEANLHCSSLSGRIGCSRNARNRNSNSGCTTSERCWPSRLADAATRRRMGRTLSYRSRITACGDRGVEMYMRVYEIGSGSPDAAHLRPRGQTEVAVHLGGELPQQHPVQPDGHLRLRHAGGNPGGLLLRLLGRQSQQADEAGEGGVADAGLLGAQARQQAGQQAVEARQQVALILRVQPELRRSVRRALMRQRQQEAGQAPAGGSAAGAEVQNDGDSVADRPPRPAIDCISGFTAARPVVQAAQIRPAVRGSRRSGRDGRDGGVLRVVEDDDAAAGRTEAGHAALHGHQRQAGEAEATFAALRHAGAVPGLQSHLVLSVEQQAAEVEADDLIPHRPGLVVQHPAAELLLTWPGAAAAAQGGFQIGQSCGHRRAGGVHHLWRAGRRKGGGRCGHRRHRISLRDTAAPEEWEVIATPAVSGMPGVPCSLFRGFLAGLMQHAARSADRTEKSASAHLSFDLHIGILDPELAALQPQVGFIAVGPPEAALAGRPGRQQRRVGGGGDGGGSDDNPGVQLQLAEHRARCGRSLRRVESYGRRPGHPAADRASYSVAAAAAAVAGVSNQADPHAEHLACGGSPADIGEALAERAQHEAAAAGASVDATAATAASKRTAQAEARAGEAAAAVHADEDSKTHRNRTGASSCCCCCCCRSKAGSQSSVSGSHSDSMLQPVADSVHSVSVSSSGSGQLGQSRPTSLTSRAAGSSSTAGPPAGPGGDWVVHVKLQDVHSWDFTSGPRSFLPAQGALCRRAASSALPMAPESSSMGSSLPDGLHGRARGRHLGGILTLGQVFLGGRSGDTGLGVAAVVGLGGVQQLLRALSQTRADSVPGGFPALSTSACCCSFRGFP